MKLISLVLFLITITLNATEINVKNFGAKGDGVSDDWDSFQKALDYAYKNKDVNQIFIPNGQYKISKTIIIYGSNLSIVGESKDKTILFKNGNLGWWGDLVYICGLVPGNKYYDSKTQKEYFYKGSKVYSQNIIIKNLSFKSTSANEEINNIGIVNSNNVTIDSCNFLESSNSNIAIVNDAAKYDNNNIVIKNCIFQNAKTHNLRVLSMNTGKYNANSVSVINSRFYQTGTTNAKELRNKHVHIWYRGGVGSKNIKLTVDNCTFDKSGVIHSTVNANNLVIENSNLAGGYVISNSAKLYPNSKVEMKNIKTDTNSSKEILGVKND
ncbi:glycosyl hydrolase family 28-related protein [Chryseobacterium tongliaoense]|uniref:glycosyl hydrolase family 28-related protein n=1 Tax=Chryseobacterium tongliaoense TaxID=3240933 RepID=UPI00351377B9